MNVEETILREFRRIAVVGLSAYSSRPSFGVASYMLAQGYIILPVNPNLAEWQGLPAYPDLRSVPSPLEIVDIFRRPEAAGEAVEEAIRAGARAGWMQEEGVDEAAAQRARKSVLLVVMDRCILKAHRALTKGHRDGGG